MSVPFKKKSKQTKKAHTQLWTLLTHLDTVLEAVKLPAAVSGLDTGLSHVDRDTFCGRKRRKMGAFVLTSRQLKKLKKGGASLSTFFKGKAARFAKMAPIAVHMTQRRRRGASSGTKKRPPSTTKMHHSKGADLRQRARKVRNKESI